VLWRPFAFMPEALANKIAAGEVVERPASVVKELVENAIDAGATQISVEVGTPAYRSIRVADNGTGMSEDDASSAWNATPPARSSPRGTSAPSAPLGFGVRPCPASRRYPGWSCELERGCYSRDRSRGRRGRDPGGIRVRVLAGNPGLGPRSLFQPARSTEVLKGERTEFGHLGGYPPALRPGQA